jgi:hypothetical protein
MMTLSLVKASGFDILRKPVPAADAKNSICGKSSLLNACIASFGGLHCDSGLWGCHYWDGRSGQYSQQGTNQ